MSGEQTYYVQTDCQSDIVIQTDNAISATNAYSTSVGSLEGSDFIVPVSECVSPIQLMLTPADYRINFSIKLDNGNLINLRNSVFTLIKDR